MLMMERRSSTDSDQRQHPGHGQADARKRCGIEPLTNLLAQQADCVVREQDTNQQQAQLVLHTHSHASFESKELRQMAKACRAVMG